MPPQYRQDRVIVKPIGSNLDRLHALFGTRTHRKYPEFQNIEVVDLPPNLLPEQAIALFKNSGWVLYAEPDYLCYPALNPNDPNFTNGKLWTLHNTAPNDPPTGTPTLNKTDADIDAPEGWNIRTRADNVTVAVIDYGICYTHEDLTDNMWRNPGEIGTDASGHNKATNGIDDDGDGYIDNVYGINAIPTSLSDPAAGDPWDDSVFSHGTHVSGIIGATGNNGKGVVGVAWGVKLMALKFINGTTDLGSLSDAIECIYFAMNKKVQIINNSWAVASGDSLVENLRDIITETRNRGILFVAAAGNWAPFDNDQNPIYPAAYPIDNVIAVAGTGRADTLGVYSHYGLVSVHVAAPGGDEPTGHFNDPYYWPYSTIADGASKTVIGSGTQYGGQMGTSMAAPMVSGALALMRAQFPSDSYLQLKNRLLSSVDSLTVLDGKCQTGGRLNLYNALSSPNNVPRNNDFAKAFTIAKPSGKASITFVANNVDATKEAGEPNHAGNSGGKSVWWKWTAPSSGSVTFSTKGSSFNTTLGVYRGSSVSTLTVVGSDNDSGQCGTSQVTFTATASTVYYIAVDGYNDGTKVDAGVVKLTLQDDSSAQPVSLKFLPNSLSRPNGNQFGFTVTGPTTANVAIDIASYALGLWSYNWATFTLSAGTYTYTDLAASQSQAFYRVRTTGNPRQECCNTIGYVDRVIPPGNSYQANPLLAADNRVSVLFASVPWGTSISKWNDATATWTVNTRDSFTGVWTDPNMTFRPGEGFNFQNNSGANLTVRFVGEVVQEYTRNPLVNGLALRSSMVPFSGLVNKDLLFLPLNRDKVYRLVGGSPTVYTYSSTSGWSPSEPSIGFGESFFIEKAAPANWDRYFGTWP